MWRRSMAQDSQSRQASARSPLAPLDIAERDLRLDRLWARMHEHGFAALVLTSEPNFRYVTNFRSATWITTTRPRYAILPLDRVPIAVVPASNAIATRSSGWIDDIRLWPAPRPEDEGISLVLEALRKPLEQGGKIGLELGSGSRLGFPGSDFLRVLQAIGQDRAADATPIMHEVRSIKSPSEIARHQAAAEAASVALSGLAPIGARSRTDRQLHRALQAALIDSGLDRIPYLVCAAGSRGYVATNLEPDDRAFRPGDVVYVDVGGTVDGYYCDFNRHVAFAAIDDETRSAYSNVHMALDAGIAAAKPGRPIGDIWTAMARVLDSHGGNATGIGRLGHAIGLSLTEWPSIVRDADTTLVPGMVLAVEPGLAYRPASGQDHPRLMVQEENIVITADGAQLLSRRGPAEIPIVH